MDILIRGMEMPKSCSQCFCMASCRLWKNIMHPEFNRHRNCPLVPVPSHGDLIDRDALKDLYHYNTHDSDIDKAWTCNIRRSIDNAPTVIKASE